MEYYIVARGLSEMMKIDEISFTGLRKRILNKYLETRTHKLLTTP